MTKYDELVEEQSLILEKVSSLVDDMRGYVITEEGLEELQRYVTSLRILEKMVREELERDNEIERREQEREEELERIRAIEAYQV